ncbi:glycosyltransferase [Brevibacterium daeguense]|uniref:4,4'-diaponeurosporenoate glycosyltransferase n=1 Tax=Brevibacterium daeguense TaxID=909936 RepID=A0ABP8EHK6_9MICO|nr:glycosyltransferase [Brevibacterium daeguense]
MRLGVIIPAYNEAAGIQATLTALARQADQDFLLVICDNSSTDATVEVIEAIRSSYRLHRPGSPLAELTVVGESLKGTGAAADTAARAAIGLGATHLARTDADCLPAADWAARVKAAFASGLELVSGQLLPRTDDYHVPAAKRWSLLAAVEVASAFGRVRPGNRSNPEAGYLGPYVMTPGCNMAITSQLYEEIGGFPRTAIEDLHEDRAVVNEVRRRTRAYGLRRDIRVHGSIRRVHAWGLVRTLGWYADHRYKPAHVDIR